MHFIITFGLPISIKSDENEKNDKSVDKKQVKTKRVHQRGKKKIKDMSETTRSSKNIINVGHILAEIHVEYELLPSYTFKFDCRCWETATKVYTENRDWSLRPTLCPIKKNVFWIIFSVHHLVHLNETQLQKFFNHAITYRIFYGNKKFSGRAKKDKVRGFYIDDNSINIGPYDFLELHPLDSVTKPLTRPLPEPITVTDEIYGDFSVTTYIDIIPDRVHECKFRKMSRKERFPPESLQAELSNVEQKSISGMDIKSSRKKQFKRNKLDKRKEVAEVIEIRLPVETLFSDMGTITCYRRTPELPGIPAVMIYTECHDILSNKQLRMDLNPISIKLEQLSNFPADMVIENGFKYLYAKMFFVNRTIVTPYYIPGKTMCFEFVKCFLCKEFQPEELINSLTTKFLTVEIIGIRIANVIEPSTSATEQHNNDATVTEKSSKSSEVSAKGEVLLGIAMFDISDLLRGVWEIRLTSSLYHPCNTSINRCNDTNDDGMTISWKSSPITSDVLVSFGTSLKIKVRLACDLQTVRQKILRRDDTLNRIFLILSDRKLIDAILKQVSAHNSTLSSTYRPSNEDNDSKVQNIPKHILTGFVVDCHEKFYIFLEGLSNGYLLKIWEMVANLPVRNNRVYYNSSCIFLTRLYEDFAPFGGIVHVKLSKSLETQLRKCSLYVGKTKTTPQADVMKRMGLMKLASTMKSLCQACLFPEPNAVKAFIDDVHKIQLKHSIWVINN